MFQVIKSLSLPMKVLLGAAAVGFVGCLAFAVSPARSALSYTSDDYVAEIQQAHVGVALIEQTGKEAEWREVSTSGAMLPAEELLGEDEALVFGEEYPEAISVRNISEDQSEYVRLTVRKYWAMSEEPAAEATPDDSAAETADEKVDAAATADAAADSSTSAAPAKTDALDPSFIKLAFDAESAGDWVFSEAESSAERLVFYYKHLLHPGTDAATPAVTAISVDKAIAPVASEYQGAWLGLSAQVDSVQASNAPAAAKSAWGVDVSQFADAGLDWSSRG